MAKRGQLHEPNPGNSLTILYQVLVLLLALPVAAPTLLAEEWDHLFLR
jgi:hypothetical protein